MNVEKKELPKKQIELSIEISLNELKPFLEKAAQEISTQKPIKGFRPGKAPYDIVVKNYGEMMVYQTAANSAMLWAYDKAIDQEKLEVVEQPEIEVKKLAPGNPFVFTAKVALMPKIDLCDLEKLSVKPMEEIKVEQEEVDKVIRQIQTMRATETLEDKKVEKGDKVELSFETFIDNVPIENGKAEKHSLVIGQGQMIPGFEDNLISLKKDDEKEFELPFPKEYHEKKLAGKKATFKIKILGVYKIVLPEIDDEFAKQLGFKDAEGLKGNLSNNIKGEKEQKATQKKELEIINLLLEKSNFDEVPEVLVNQELHKMMHEMQENVAKQGMKYEDYLSHIKKTESELKLDLTPDAIKRVKTGLLIREFAIKNNIKPEEKEIEEEIQKTLASYKLNPAYAAQIDDLEKNLRTNNAKRYFENMLANRKTIQFIKDKVIKQ